MKSKILVMASCVMMLSVCLIANSQNVQAKKLQPVPGDEMEYGAQSLYMCETAEQLESIYRTYLQEGREAGGRFAGTLARVNNEYKRAVCSINPVPITTIVLRTLNVVQGLRDKNDNEVDMLILKIRVNVKLISGTTQHIMDAYVGFKMPSEHV